MIEWFRTRRAAPQWIAYPILIFGAWGLGLAAADNDWSSLTVGLMIAVALGAYARRAYETTVIERTRNTLTIETTWKRVKADQESTPHPDVAQPEPAESPTRRIPTFFVVVGVACWILAVNVLFNHGSKENNTAGLLSLAGFLALIGWGVYSLRRRRPSGAAAAVTVPHGDVPPNASEPLPEIADALAPGNADRSTQARLAELERLAGAGVITTAERNSRRTAIIEEI